MNTTPHTTKIEPDTPLNPNGDAKNQLMAKLDCLQQPNGDQASLYFHNMNPPSK